MSQMLLRLPYMHHGTDDWGGVIPAANDAARLHTFVLEPPEPRRQALGGKGLQVPGSVDIGEALSPPA